MKKYNDYVLDSLQDTEMPILDAAGQLPTSIYTAPLPTIRADPRAPIFF